ncbi:MAG TPA: hypothetical protein ENI87_03220, partial [bacterium]|nr:hypothetical protein [bacterium]
MNRRTLAFAQVLIALAVAAPAEAQEVPPGGFQREGTAGAAPRPQVPAGQPRGATNTFGLPSGQGQGPDEFSSIWSTPTRPRGGFPQFPSQLSGYGNYPLPSTGGEGAVSTQDPLAPIGLPLPPAEPEPPGWPSWVRTAARRPLPFAVDVGLLISQGERVWHRPASGEPFVPLMFFDKFATLAVGGAVEVRRTGAFELLLHQSTRIETHGPTRLEVEALSESEVALSFEHLTWVSVQVTGRQHRLRLPDGSAIEIAPPPPAAGSATAGLAGLFGTPIAQPPQPVQLELRRADEPGWYGGRATIANLGGREVV